MKIIEHLLTTFFIRPPSRSIPMLSTFGNPEYKKLIYDKLIKGLESAANQIKELDPIYENYNIKWLNHDGGLLCKIFGETVEWDFEQPTEDALEKPIKPVTKKEAEMSILARFQSNQDKLCELAGESKVIYDIDLMKQCILVTPLEWEGIVQREMERISSDRIKDHLYGDRTD